jgi:hypothetical protein
MIMPHLRCSRDSWRIASHALTGVAIPSRLFEPNPNRHLRFLLLQSTRAYELPN